MKNTALGTWRNSFLFVLSPSSCAWEEPVPVGRKRKKSAVGAEERKGQRVCFPPSDLSKGSSVKKPHPNPQLTELLWANKTSKGSLSLPIPFPLWKGEVTPCQGWGPSAVPQQGCHSPVTSLSPTRPGAPAGAAATDPPALLKAAGPGELKDPVKSRVCAGPQPRSFPTAATDVLGLVALLRQRAIAEFSCPGYFFPSSMNHLLKIL